MQLLQIHVFFCSYRESRMLESDERISIKASDFASGSTGCSTGSVCIAIATHDQVNSILPIFKS